MKKYFCPDLTVPGEHLVYGSRFEDVLEEIRNGLRYGFMRVSLDWSRTPWDTNVPINGIVYRVTVLPKKASNRLGESVAKDDNGGVASLGESL